MSGSPPYRSIAWREEDLIQLALPDTVPPGRLSVVDPDARELHRLVCVAHDWAARWVRDQAGRPYQDIANEVEAMLGQVRGLLEACR